ncbi:hypothetical protein [Pseudomonas sp. NPDC096925]|uniref:hypothetical protein n=1 Tax=Pseudomonas sp. NPDC096925 TaxID=3364484 RepID=UPI00383B876C
MTTLTDEQLAGARKCAAFMRKYLPQHFTEHADVVMVGDYVMIEHHASDAQAPRTEAGLRLPG